MKRVYINHISFILDSMGATREREQPLAASQEREKCKKQILETDTSICNMHILCNGRHDQVAKLAAMNITDAAPLIAIFILMKFQKAVYMPTLIRTENFSTVPCSKSRGASFFEKNS